ncbi:MAG: site-2 protease family protein [Candidatus Paceibacterota bacterium]
MDPLSFIVVIILLILSVMAHELAHGYAAESLGDPTARLAGRLTLNPFAHLDVVGSFIVPVLTFFGGFIIGWAKPVPYNPYNLRHARWGEAFVAGAGPLTNIFLALFFALLIRFNVFSGIFSVIDQNLIILIVYINVILAVINLIPIPPIDGSKILSALLPLHLKQHFFHFETMIQNTGFLGILVILFLILFVFGNVIFTGILSLTGLLTGLSFLEVVTAVTSFF